MGGKQASKEARKRERKGASKQASARAEQAEQDEQASAAKRTVFVDSGAFPGKVVPSRRPASSGLAMRPHTIQIVP